MEGQQYVQLVQESWNNIGDEFYSQYTPGTNQTTVFHKAGSIEINDTEEGKIVPEFTTNDGDILVNY